MTTNEKSLEICKKQMDILRKWKPGIPKQESKPWIQNQESRTRNPKPGIQNKEFKSSNPKQGFQNQEHKPHKWKSQVQLKIKLPG